MNVPDPAGRLRQAFAALEARRPDKALALARGLLNEAGHAARDRNDLGSLLMRLGEPLLAVQAFEDARQVDATNFEYCINHSIALSAAGRGDAALRVLAICEREGRTVARYWSVRAGAARNADRLQEARIYYEKALRCDAAYDRARQGLAQVALEQGDENAVALYDACLKTDPRNPYLRRSKAEALHQAGHLSAALSMAWQIVADAPHWTDGLELLAQLRLAAGEADYTSHYREALRRCPDDPNIPAAWISVLAGLDHHARAAEVAQDAAKRFVHLPLFGLLEAVHSGSAGDDARADALFAQLRLDTTARHLHEARHRIRMRQYCAAEKLLERVIATEPWNTSAWALLSLMWRVRNDARHQWLHGREEFVRKVPLQIGDDTLAEAVRQLRQLHARSALPLNQSLRGGTQTRGRLFARKEPVFAKVFKALEAAIIAYQQHLPLADPTHPLLRHRDAKLRLAGSWSVRLTGGGDHHTAHIHPQGTLSSALYLVVPDRSQREGVLELGRPPADLRLDLPPERIIEPETGYLALFPSTLYHGTTPFSAAERITVAFDVVPTGTAG